MSKKKKMNYGKKDVLTPDDLDMKNAKIRITTMIDFPVYEELKAKAERLGIGYQTLLNMVLRSFVRDEVLTVRTDPAEKKPKKKLA